MCEISIIIPIYNGERYLAECLDSVCRSTIFEKCEVILIDDGSEDSSPDIIKRYETLYSTVHGYTFSNQGPGTSRNRGIRLARGTYIFFLDSDDMVEPDYLEKLYQEMVSGACDLVCAGYSIWKRTKKQENGVLKNEAADKVIAADNRTAKMCEKSLKEEIEQIPVQRKVLETARCCSNQGAFCKTDGKKDKVSISGADEPSCCVDGCTWLEQRMDAGDWINQVWCALYNRQFLVDNQIKFCEEIYLYEDVLFTTEVLLCAQTVGHVPSYGYLYRSHDNGLVNGGIRMKDVECCIGILKLMRERYRDLKRGQMHLLNRLLAGILKEKRLHLLAGLNNKSFREQERMESRQLHALGRVAAEMVSMYVYFLKALHLPGQEERLWLRKLSDMGWKLPMLYSVSSGKELVKWGLCSFVPKLYYVLVNKGQNPVRTDIKGEAQKSVKADIDGEVQKSVKADIKGEVQKSVKADIKGEERKSMSGDTEDEVQDSVKTDAADNQIENILVSVVIPCYNSASTLADSLDSVCRQTYRRLEILVVDDGSEDESWSIIQSFEQKDRRVHGIRQPHAGVSAARNLGVQSAKGIYIQFADADDRIDPNFTKYMVHLQEKKPNALVVCDYRQYSEGQAAMEHFSMAKGYYTKKRWMSSLVKKPEAHYFGVLWNKLYRRDLIIKNGCHFPETVSLGEDFIFNMQYLTGVTGVVCTNRKLYQYLWKRKGGLTEKTDAFAQYAQMAEARLRMYEAYRIFFQKEGLTGLWNFWLHYYMVVAFFRVCDEKPAKEVQDRYYQAWIADCGISRAEYRGYLLLRKAKQMKSRFRK